MLKKSQFVRMGIIALICASTNCANSDWTFILPVANEQWSADNFHDSEGTYGVAPAPDKIRLELRCGTTLVSSCQAIKDGMNPNWDADTADHRLQTDGDFLGANVVTVLNNTVDDQQYTAREYQNITVTNGGA